MSRHLTTKARRLARGTAWACLPAAYWRGRYRRRFDEHWRNSLERTLYENMIDPDRPAVDVGANNGIVSHLLAQLCPTVHAFEPNPDIFKTLELTAAGNVETYNAALGQTDGSLQLQVPVRNGQALHGWGSIAHGFDDASLHTYVVPIRRLDDQPLDDVGFIKIDVEGFEDSVLRGAAQTIERRRPVLYIEIEERHRREAVAWTSSWLAKRGYNGFFAFDCDLLEITAFSPKQHQNVNVADLERFYANNFIFIPRSLGQEMSESLKLRLGSNR